MHMSVFMNKSCLSTILVLRQISYDFKFSYIQNTNALTHLHEILIIQTTHNGKNNINIILPKILVVVQLNQRKNGK